jgi:hypothetical protein
VASRSKELQGISHVGRRHCLDCWFCNACPLFFFYNEEDRASLDHAAGPLIAAARWESGVQKLHTVVTGGRSLQFTGRALAARQELDTAHSSRGRVGLGLLAARERSAV